MSTSDMWACGRCTVLNKPSCSTCKVCFLSREDSDNQTKTWQCQNCCQFSPVSSSTCIVCDFQSLAFGGLGNAGDEPLAGVQGAEGQTENSAGDARKLQTQPESDKEAKPAGDQWMCEKSVDSSVCSTLNSWETYRCSNCNSIKPYLARPFSELQVETGSPAAGIAKADWDLAKDNGCTEGSAVLQGHDDTPGPPPEHQSHARLSEVRSPVSVRATDHRDQDMAGVGHQDEGTDEVLEFPDQECRMVLVGKTGNGKSCTGNTILGLPRFAHSQDFASTTKTCQRHNNVRFGVHLEVVDTPGLFDTDLDEATIVTEIARCLGIVSPGPHAIVVVLRIGVRFTEEEIKAIEKLDEIFGVQLIRFLVIVFTYGDILDQTVQGGQEAALKEMLAKSPSKLKELLQRAQNRYVVFDNTASKAAKDHQVKNLLQTIGRLLKVNGGKPYTSKLLQTVERRMHERERELEKELQGDRGNKEQRGRYWVDNFQYRDMVRDEVAHGTRLLDRIKTDILPLLMPVIMVVLRILLGRGITHLARACNDGVLALHISRALHRRRIPNGCLKAHAQSLCASKVLKYVQNGVSALEIHSHYTTISRALHRRVIPDRCLKAHA